MNIRKLYLFGVVALLLLGILAPAVLAQDATGTPAAAGTSTAEPLVEVSDQDIVDGTVTIDRVVATEQSWIMIHRDMGGEFESVIGYAPVPAGESTNVVVEIDVASATPTLHAMLHTDAGEVGVYEFPGPDAPTQLNGQIVVEPFQVTGGLDVTPGVTATVGVSPTVAATATTAPTAQATVGVTATVGATGTASAVGTPGGLPVTGGSPAPWALIVLAVGGLLLVGGLGLALARRS